MTRGAAMAEGMTWRTLRGGEWASHLHGVHTPTVLDPSDPWTRILEVAELLPPGAALTGWAAAYLLGALDLDGRHGRSGALHPVDVWVGPSGRIRARPGLVRLDRRELGDDEIVAAHGIPVTERLRTCWSMTSRLPVEEGVVVADAMCRTGLDVADLADYVRAAARRKGAPRARTVLGLVDPGARSCPESRLRVIWVLDAGLPPPLVNVEVRGPSGRLLGLPDLLDHESGLVGEYDGAGHREAEQHRADNVREERFESANLVVVRAGSADLHRHRGTLVRRLRDGRARGLARVRSLDRWRVHRT